MNLYKHIFWLVLFLGISSYAESNKVINFFDSIPVTIKGKHYFLKNETDKKTRFYYVFSTADHNEFYDIRTKKVLWTRSEEERKNKPIWKKLPKRRKFKKISNGKVYYKYFENDSLIKGITYHNGIKTVTTDDYFVTFDNSSKTSMSYNAKTGEIKWRSGRAHRVNTTPYKMLQQGDWERIPSKNKYIYREEIRIPSKNDLVYDVPEQAFIKSNIKGYKKLSKVETISKKLKNITRASEQNKIDRVVIFYNKKLKILHIKKEDTSLKIDVILLLKGTENVIKKLNPKEFIDISKLTKGVYYITLKTKGENIVSYRCNVYYP